MKQFLAHLMIAGALVFSAQVLVAQTPESKPASAPASRPASPETAPKAEASKPEKNAPKNISSISNVDKKQLGISGYDPVSYFSGKPVKGPSDYTAIYEGITYRFASKANQDKFKANPESFAPAYGGWCAYAMVDGEKVDVDPKTYKIVDGKLLLFYNGLFGNTRAKWDEKNENDQLTSANGHWNEILKTAP